MWVGTMNSEFSLPRLSVQLMYAHTIDELPIVDLDMNV